MICLLPNCCFLSETSRMLEIYRARTARGVPVRVATHGGTWEGVLREAGVPCDVLGPGWGPMRCEAFVRSVPGIGSPDQSMWSDEELRSYAALEADYFRAHDVRVAVTGWTLTALLSTRLAGIQLVTEHAGAYVPPVFESDLLPVPTSVALPRPIRRLPSGLRRRMYNAGVSRLDLWTSGFNRVARELRVEGIPSFPALLLGDLTLVTDVPEVLGLPREDVDEWRPRRAAAYRAGARMRYVGPIFAHFDTPIPERVEQVLDAGRPVVYVAITSSPQALVRAVVAALRPLGARIIVAATRHDLRDLEGDDVIIEPLLPSHKIMPRVDLAVTAGGQGSVQTALASGVPLIGIPLQPEQDANVFLAQHHGAARLVAQRDAGTEAMTSAARELLADAAYRTNAARIARIYAAADGPGAAADAIIELGEVPRSGRVVQERRVEAVAGQLNERAVVEPQSLGDPGQVVAHVAAEVRRII